MSTKIILPQLGESLHEGTIGKWLKQVGEPVEEYESIVEIITDKVNTEVPAPITGTLSAILVKEGDTVEVGTVIGEMVEVGAPVAAGASLGSVITGESEHQRPQEPTVPAQQMEAAFAPATTPKAAELNRTADKALNEVSSSFPNGISQGGWYDGDEEDTYGGVVAASPSDGEKPRHRYTPAVRRLAQEHNLDLARLGLRGSGLGGRITRDDVLRYIEQQRLLHQPVPTRALPRESSQPPATSHQPAAMESLPPVSGPSMHEQIAANAMRQPSQAQAPLAPAPVVKSQQPPAPVFSEAAVTNAALGSGEELIPLTPMRKAIAEHMVRSVQTSPHAWTIVEVDMTRLVRHRAQIKEEFKQREGLELTYLPFVIKAVVEGLRQFPQLNASFAPDGSGLIIKRDLNIGVAIDVPDGLVVPVIQRADEKSLVGLARSLNDLITRARAKKLALSDVQGGTFTVNNPGAFGSVMSQPIINQPQAAIVTMEAIVKRPVVVSDAEGNDTVVVRSMMNMCLSFDHRVVDGAMAGRFLQFLKKWLETRDYSAGF
jgi:2-oxoisovalerate dehydrogenase E2 component (dihydrolipoyl transacylase)